MPLTDIGPQAAHIFARRFYDGVAPELQLDRVIQIEDGRITAVRPARASEAGGRDLLAFDLIAPGFIDLQINGARDTQFNADPTPEAIARIAEGARQGGTAFILPTFITAPGNAYSDAIAAAREAMAQGVPGILGVHLEGPFLSPDRAGIHDPGAIRPMNDADIAILTGAAAGGPGVILLTVAPERLPQGALGALVRAGIRVFAGHSAATADQIANAEKDGLSGATHLFNAMSQMTGRAPGVVGGVLSSDSLFAGLIADGHHVDWRNVRIAARLMPDRLCLVTDAMLTLEGQQTAFMLHGERIALRDGRLTDRTGRLAGAHVSLIDCVRNMCAHGGVGLPAALRMVTSNPARALGMEREVGILRAGCRAAFTCLDLKLEVTDVMVGGRHFSATRHG